jgi:hypothetical protein
VAKPTGGLTEWFGKGPKGDWVDIGAPKKDGKFQKCGRKSAKSSKRKYPKCVPRAKAKSMTAAQRRSAVRRKRAAGNPGGKPTNVKTILKKKDGGIVSRMHKGCGAVMPERRKRTKFS